MWRSATILAHLNTMQKISETEVCIVGGGPAGVVLAYILARNGIHCELLERHDDFDRDFRGDTLHAGVMEVFEQLGLAEKILELPHYKIRKMEVRGKPLIDFGRLKTKFPFVTMIAQSTLLDFLAKEMENMPEFTLRMGATACGLTSDENSTRVCGVNYRKDGEEFSVRAKLIVACDGRASRIRKEAGLEMIPVTDPIDVLWFRLSKKENGEKTRSSGALTGGRIPFIVLERPDQYQIAAIIPHGGFKKIRDKGLPAFHQRLREASPDLADTAEKEIDDWEKIAFLSVTGSRLKRWWLPGLMLIGDAAHTMTPVGGVGINYAIWDAVETANVIVPALKNGREIDGRFLHEIQRRRERATKRMQRIQRFAGRRILEPATEDEAISFEPPKIVCKLLQLPLIRDLLPKQIAYGGSRKVRLNL